MKAKVNASILIVDDEKRVLTLIKKRLSREGFEIRCEQTAEAGLKMIAENNPKVVIADYKLPGMDGIAFLKQVNQNFPKIQKILLSGYVSVKEVEEAINHAQIFRLLLKPFEDNALIKAVQEAISNFAVAEKNERLAEMLNEQNQVLRELNTTLEQKVNERTNLLISAKKTWEQTFDAINDPLSIVDLKYNIIRSNKAVSTYAKIPIYSITKHKCYHIFSSNYKVCQNCPIEDCLESKEPISREVRMEENETIFHLAAFPIKNQKGVIDSVVCYYKDVTEEKELSRQLMQADKLAAVGQLAGGIAHEINNPLGGILAFTQILLREVSDPQSEQFDYLKEIEKSALRCKGIVENLLNFSRPSPVEQRTVVNINNIVLNSLFLIEHQFNLKNVKIIKELEENLFPVLVNTNQIHQVLLNLITNAYAAMPTGGLITLVSRNDLENQLIELIVRDTGVGIAEKNLGKIFEPFFTTKEVGQGTGLGLTVSYGIIKEHRGTIKVKSEVNRGTEFVITLPAIEER